MFLTRWAFATVICVLVNALVMQRGRTNDLAMIMLIGSFFAAPFTLIVAGIAYQLEKTFVSAASGPIVAGVALGIAYFAAPNRQNFMAASEGLVVQVIVFGVLWSLSAWLFASKTIS